MKKLNLKISADTSYQTIVKYKDKETLLKALKLNSSSILYASKELRLNKEMAEKAVEYQSDALFYLDEHFKNDKGIISKALTVNPLLFNRLDTKFRKDRDLILIAISNCGEIIKYLEPEFRKDREIANIAIKKNTTAFKYIHPDLQNEREFALIAVQNLPVIYKDLSFDLKNDRDIIKLVAKYQSIVHYMPEKYFSDKEIMLMQIKKEARNYYYIAKELKKDPHVIDILLEKISNIQFLDQSLDDRDLIEHIAERHKENVMMYYETEKETDKSIDRKMCGIVYNHIKAKERAEELLSVLESKSSMDSTKGRRKV